MSRAKLSHIAHGDHPIAAPLSVRSVQHVIERAKLQTNAKVLDIGCGEGAWVIQVLQSSPTANAVALDLSEYAVEATRTGGLHARVADRLTVHHGAAMGFDSDERFDAVFCVGATHAFGGLSETLAGVVKWLAPGGVLILGEGFWAKDPTEQALRSLDAREDDFASLSVLVARLDAAGWTPVYAHVSCEDEWDEYEWSWTGTLARWSFAHPDDPLATEARSLSRSHREAWLNGYRGVLGFVTFVLIRTVNSLTDHPSSNATQ